MIVCVCNAIREKQLEGALAQGASSACQAFQKLGCKPACGKCVPAIRQSIGMRAISAK